MAQINGNDHLNPRLREIALRIVTKPGFDGSDKSLTCALEEWRKALTPEDWRFTADVLICRYLLDVRAEFDEGLPVPRQRTPDPQPPRVGGIRFVDAVVEPEPESADDPVDDTDAGPGAVLRHSSESEDWSAPSVPEKAPELERTPAPPKRKTPPPTPKFGPVVVSHVSDRVSEPEPQTEPEAPAAKPVPIQQNSWKTEAARNLKGIPSLANRITINGVAMREGALTKGQIPLRLEQIAAQRRGARYKITHLRATIDRRLELNRQTEAEERVQRALDREFEAEELRLTAVAPVLAERPVGTTITDLDLEVLIECGYERRAA